jgi:hypothetical protein
MDMHLSAGLLVPAIVAISFAAGLNVYATVATLGLLGRFGVVALPPELHMLSSTWVIAASVLLFLIELVADKIPVFDLFWNAAHTFVRVPVAALLAYGAAAHLSPPMQAACAALGALVALAAHGGKTAARTAITTSPEPVSNVALSVGEDVLSVGLVWLATEHPIIAALIAIAFLAVIVLLARAVIRALGGMFRRRRPVAPGEGGAAGRGKRPARRLPRLKPR